MDNFELASGAATNWSKTVGIRIGTMQGAQPDATVPSVMRSIDWHDTSTAPPQRYLGVWLGGKDQIQTEFTRRVSAKLLDRINHNAKRRPATWRGRSGVLKTLCFSTAVYHLMNQEPAGLHDLISQWQKEAWCFQEATLHGEHAAAARGDALRTQSLVKRDGAIQKPCDGGSSALDVQSAVDSLKLTWIVRLCSTPPNNHGRHSCGKP